jgi:hypothetical protein
LLASRIVIAACPPLLLLLLLLHLLLLLLLLHLLLLLLLLLLLPFLLTKLFWHVSRVLPLRPLLPSSLLVPQPPLLVLVGASGEERAQKLDRCRQGPDNDDMLEDILREHRGDDYESA